MEQLRDELIAAARAAAKHAYCPYSQYPVGAAVLGADGMIYSGCNIENASYGLTNCAERTALFKAVSSGAKKFKALAVVGGKQLPATPCGACRQVMSEFCTAATPVFISTLAGAEIISTTLGELLPLAFGAGTLPEQNL